MQTGWERDIRNYVDQMKLSPVYAFHIAFKIATKKKACCQWNLQKIMNYVRNRMGVQVEATASHEKFRPLSFDRHRTCGWVLCWWRRVRGYRPLFRINPKACHCGIGYRIMWSRQSICAGHWWRFVRIIQAILWEIHLQGF